MTKKDSLDDATLRSAFSKRGFAEPDLTVVVGGEEFQHHSVLFCLASEYFDKMLSADTKASHTRKIEFPHGDPKEWVRFCRYLDPRSTFTSSTYPVSEADAMELLPWFHRFGMTNLRHECDERLLTSSSSPKFLEADLEDVDHELSTMTDIRGWIETATTYEIPKTLDAVMKELKKAADAFPEILTEDILENIRPFWSTPAGIELWDVVKAMIPDDVKSCQDDAELQADKGLFKIVAKSCEVPAQIRTLKSKADFNAIVKIMTNYRYCPQIQQEGCAAFRDPIMQTAEAHILSAVEGGIEAIVSAMTTHTNVSMVQEHGCAALGNLICSDENCIMIAAKDGIEAIVSGLTAHKKVSKVQEWGCLALGNLARNPANCVSIAEKDGIEAIVKAMKKHSKNSGVQKEGCDALANLACNPTNKVSIAEKHGIEVIVNAMTAHINESTVQEQACLALGNLARNDANNSVSIAAKDGIEAIVSAMTAHTNVLMVQEQGCGVLGSLARNNDANRISIESNGGIEAIVSAMAAHSKNPEMQGSGCGTLGNLASNNDVNRVSIAAKGGIEAVVSAMTAHSDVSKVQVQGCGALGNLASNNDANCESIAAKDGIEAIVSAMTAHSDVSMLQQRGCLALFNLCFNASVFPMVAEKGGVAVLEQNPGNKHAETALTRLNSLNDAD
jgi:hypothetical protein